MVSILQVCLDEKSGGNVLDRNDLLCYSIMNQLFVITVISLQFQNSLPICFEMQQESSNKTTMYVHQHIVKNVLLKSTIFAVVAIFTISLAIISLPVDQWNQLSFYINFRRAPKLYIASLPYGRLSNRYLEITNMMRLAYHLKRTLVLLPYHGVEFDKMFNLEAVNKQFRWNYLSLTWKKYQQMQNITCLCLKTIYDSPYHPISVPVCRIITKKTPCKLIHSNPIRGEQRVQLNSIGAALETQDPFMVVSGRWALDAKRIRGFPKILKAQKDKRITFHLDYVESVWTEAQRIYRWLVSRSNSSNNVTLAIHIRRSDLAYRMNLTTFLQSAKRIAVKCFVPETQIFILTDGNAAEIKIIRQTFSLAQIECPGEVSLFCKHHVRRLLVLQAVASLTTHFVGNPASSFTGVINIMRATNRRRST